MLDRFINLYNETEYTMLRSSLRIKDLVKAAKNDNLDYVAITDLDNMYGVIPFYLECIENNIKPIIGSHITLESDFNYFNSILLICKNNIGYKNLLKIVTSRKLEKKLTIEMIKPFLEGLFVILPSDEHELIKAFKEKNEKNLNTILNKYQDIKDLYIGLDMQTKEMINITGDIINFFEKKNISCIAIHKTTYLNKSDFKVYKILRCVKENVKDYNETPKEKNQFYLSTTLAKDLFRYYPSLITNIALIVENCNVELEFGNYHMPKYDITKTGDTNEYLRNLAFIGLKRRLEADKVVKGEYQKYIDRLTSELEVIVKMGFADYFLIVYDFICYAKKEKILVGPGRGSGPSSLVSYSLGITEIDPLKYDLFFERFLNPQRVSMPDIDTDFPENRRSQVLSYMGKRYGKLKVAHICTFGTYGPKAAVRDIARITNLDSNYLNEILFYINNHNSINDVIESSEMFRRMIEEDETINYVVELIKNMENLPRNLSVHAAGIIMADSDLVDYTPLEAGLDGLYTTQYSAQSLEKLGLVKIDFLGLSNLNTIDAILKMINDKINIYKLPLDDKKVYEMIASGNTYGLFQIESAGMKKVLQDLKTNCFNDIVSALALYRPGPMEMIPTFVKRKLGLEKITYLHKDLEDILKPTYGIIVFQEQLLQIASKFAGYSLGEADILRRAISKKNKELLALNEEKFIKGAVSKGYSATLAKQIFDYILKFASYGFNKSHSVAYSMVTYQMAYLKVHYFKEFMSVMMSEKLGNIALIKSYILECRKNGIDVKPPNINKSSACFTIDKENASVIYYALQGINSLGQITVNDFLKERSINGLYSNYDEFIRRTKNIFSKKNVETLIYSGALDVFNITRKSMIDEYEQSLELASFGGMFKDSLSTHVFGEDEFSFSEISNYEYQALGLNLKYDIFIKYNDVRNKYKTVKINNLKHNKIVFSVFMLKSIKKIKTKNNEEMCFVSIYDETGELDGVIFPNVYKEYAINLIVDKMYIGEVKLEERGEKNQVEIRKIKLLD